MRSPTIAVAMLIFVAVFAGSHFLRAAAAATDELTLVTIEHDGQPRTYYVHAPAQRHSGSRYPVLLVLHGGG